MNIFSLFIFNLIFLFLILAGASQDLLQRALTDHFNRSFLEAAVQSKKMEYESAESLLMGLIRTHSKESVCAAFNSLNNDVILHFEDALHVVTSIYADSCLDEVREVANWIYEVKREKIYSAMNDNSIYSIESTWGPSREIYVNPVDYPHLAGPHPSVPGLHQGDVVLTFDDRPYQNPYSKDPSSKYYKQNTTQMVLDVLTEENTQVLFFLLGSQLGDFQDKIIHPFYLGHTLGSHSYSHKNMSQISSSSAERDILKGRQAIWDAFSIDSPFFRFPFGGESGRLDIVRRNQMTSFHWESL